MMRGEVRGKKRKKKPQNSVDAALAPTHARCCT
jgi:hypothetical protein